MLGKVISFVGATFAPEDMELLLADTITDPIESHVNGFGTFLLDRIIGDAGCGAIVSLDRSRGLRMAQLFKRNAQ